MSERFNYGQEASFTEKAKHFGKRILIVSALLGSAAIAVYALS